MASQQDSGAVPTNLSRKRVQDLPEGAKQYLRVLLIAGEAPAEVRLKYMDKGYPGISVRDVVWFRESDPAILASLAEFEKEIECRAHHPLAGMVGRVQFYIHRFEQIERFRLGNLRGDDETCFLTSLTPKEERDLLSAQFDLIRRIGVLVDDKSCSKTARERAQRWLENSDYLSGDETAYVEDRDKLEATICGETMSVFIPMADLAVLRDIERVFHDQARLLIEEILTSDRPEDGLWAVRNPNLPDHRGELSALLGIVAREQHEGGASQEPRAKRAGRDGQGELGRQSAETSPGSDADSVGTAQSITEKTLAAMQRMRNCDFETSEKDEGSEGGEGDERDHVDDDTAWSYELDENVEGEEQACEELTQPDEEEALSLLEDAYPTFSDLVDELLAAQGPRYRAALGRHTH